MSGARASGIWLDEHPKEQDTFALAHTGLSRRVAPLIATSYPWREVQRVCDVGGGLGVVLSELLVRHPHLTGVLCDAPSVLPSAEHLFRQRGVHKRTTLAASNFFESVPAHADVYLLKNVLHDWSDADCLRILAACRRAMRPSERILIAERTVDRSSGDVWSTLSDAHRMVTGRGKERTQLEYAKLLFKSGFRTGRTFKHPLLDLLEFIAV